MDDSSGEEYFKMWNFGVDICFYRAQGPIFDRSLSGSAVLYRVKYNLEEISVLDLEEEEEEDDDERLSSSFGITSPNI